VPLKRTWDNINGLIINNYPHIVYFTKSIIDRMNKVPYKRIKNRESTINITTYSTVNSSVLENNFIVLGI